jgi:hypothetical protein
MCWFLRSGSASGRRRRPLQRVARRALHVAPLLLALRRVLPPSHRARWLGWIAIASRCGPSDCRLSTRRLKAMELTRHASRSSSWVVELAGPKSTSRQRAAQPDPGDPVPTGQACSALDRCRTRSGWRSYPGGSEREDTARLGRPGDVPRQAGRPEPVEQFCPSVPIWNVPRPQR